MTSKCTLVPEKIQTIVNVTGDSILLKTIEAYTAEILAQLGEYIKCATGIDLLELLKYLIILASLIWIVELLSHFLNSYLCWFKCCRFSSSSSCSSHSSSSDSSSSTCKRR